MFVQFHLSVRDLVLDYSVSFAKHGKSLSAVQPIISTITLEFSQKKIAIYGMLVSWLTIDTLLCCSNKLLLSPRRVTRKISKIPFKVLDAPELQDDFYLNLLDWSSQNLLAVGLGTAVYLWSACTCQVCVCVCALYFDTWYASLCTVGI